MTTEKPEVTNLDIDAHETVQTAVVVLKDPSTGAPTKSTITIMGPDHPTRKKIYMDRQRKLRQELARSGQVLPTDPLDDEQDEIDYLVTITDTWDLTKAGQPLPFSAAVARELYTDPKRSWLRAQIKKAAGESERFINSSAKA